MKDRREALIEAGLAMLREEGLAGLTQPRVAARAGLKQGNLTYYFPTRSELLEAVARAAIDRQLAAADEMVSASSGRPEKVVDALAVVLTRHETTRVLVGLGQAADQEPAVRALFNELAEGFLERLGTLLRQLGIEPTAARLDMAHGLLVGLSVIDLATGRRNNRARVRAALELFFRK